MNLETTRFQMRITTVLEGACMVRERAVQLGRVQRTRYTVNAPVKAVRYT